MSTTPRIWWLAATLSMCVPGLGQVYNGQLLRGVLLCLLMVLSGIGPFVWILVRGSLFLWLAIPLLLLLCVHIWIITDAMVVARRLAKQEYQPRWCNRLAVYVVFSVAVFVVFQVAERVVIRRSFEIWEVPGICHEGTLHQGDRVLVNRIAYGLRHATDENPSRWRRNPRRGEVVLYRDPSEPERLVTGRCIATSGQKVAHGSGMVVIDDTDRIYFSKRFNPSGPKDTFTVPERQVAVLAGQPSGSQLEQDVTLVPRVDLIGQPMLVIWAIDPSTRKARLDRIGIPVL